MPKSKEPCPTCDGTGTIWCDCLTCRTTPWGCSNPGDSECGDCDGTGNAPCQYCGEHSDDMVTDAANEWSCSTCAETEVIA